MAKFILVRWLDEENLSVVPASAARSGEKVYVGAFGKYKWGGKFYEGEILGLSEDRQAMQKLLDRIVRMETTREEILEQAQCEVDTTTPTTSPIKSKKLKLTTKQSAKSTTKIEKNAKIAAAKERAKQLFEKNRSNSPSDSEMSGSSPMVLQLQKELAELKKKMESRDKASSSITVNKIKQSKFEALQKTLMVGQAYPREDEYVSESYSDIDEECFDDNQKRSSVRSALDDSKRFSLDETTDETTPKRSSLHTSSSFPRSLSQSGFGATTSKRSLPSAQHPSPLQSDNDATDPSGCVSQTQPPLAACKSPQQVELIEGYGVYLTKRQLDEAVDQSCNSASRLMRNLLMVFFTPSVLASSSCLGTRKFPGLNKDITGACFRFVQSRHPNVMRSSLVDAVNDKCANYRRKRKTA